MNEIDPSDSLSKAVVGRAPRAVTAPGDGERRAQRGYTRQYESAAAAIYHGLDRGDLRWIGLADRGAGIADDVVLGYDHDVIGHQFKTSLTPSAFRIQPLLTGSNGLLTGLVGAWQKLRKSWPDQVVRIRLIVSDTPSENDRLTDDGGTTRQFIEVWRSNPTRPLAEWRTSSWASLIEHLHSSSGLDEPTFEEFFAHLELSHGGDPDFANQYGVTPQSQPQVDRIAQRLPKLIARTPEQDHWTRQGFLEEMGWRDDAEPRHVHQFPVGVAVQRNATTEGQLRAAINATISGYISVVGPPGSGKSTLLQIAFEAEPRLIIVRYLAFVPGVAHGIGRAEAVDFHEDVIAGLRRSGLHGKRFRRESAHERHEELETLLAAAGARFQEEGIRTVIVVDGLDHVPREERPEQSFLTELPLPNSIPPGVVFVLGTQRVDLPGIPPSVRDQATVAGRHLEIAPLSQVAIAAMAEALGLPETVSRSRVLELAQGHPLATHYLIQALLVAEDSERARIMDDGFEYGGDIDALYASAIRELEGDPEAMDILGVIARAEAPLDLAQLEQFYSHTSIERTWRAVRHLLVQRGRAWSIFHNSFRLFVVRLPSMRYGVLDTGHSARLYRQLVEVASSANSDSTQRHLQLRYLLRAEAHTEALALATPAHFRKQFLEGRSADDIQADIRLAYSSLKESQDPVAAFQLILSADEISRRLGAIEQAGETVDALLAIGDIEQAEAFIHEVGGDGYPVVAAWLEGGNFDRARLLFERIEPLHDLAIEVSGRPLASRHDELQAWVEQAIHFRTAPEIVAGIERIVGFVGQNYHPFDHAEDLGNYLLLRAAMAAVSYDPDQDIAEMISSFRLQPEAEPTLTLLACRTQFARGNTEIAATLANHIVDDNQLSEAEDWLRLAVALEAARNGMTTLAESLADGLPAPAIADADDTSEYASAKRAAHAVISHAELAALLNRPNSSVSSSRRKVLRPLQQFSETAGRMSGRCMDAEHTVHGEEIANECTSFIRYVCRARPKDADDFFPAQQLTAAAPTVLGSFFSTAFRLGTDQLAMVVTAVEGVLREYPAERDRLVALESRLACEVARSLNDTVGAERRLDELLGRRDQNTPSEFISSTARLAADFARIGRKDRARALLALARSEALGYSVRAKKDPQYAFWISLMRAANHADPRGRSRRVRALARQCIGMALTEGSDAAGRIAHELIVEAALDGPDLGWNVARDFIQADLISFPDSVDALMIGLVKRSSDNVKACVATWTSLCLPFHRAPYYGRKSETWFIREAIRAASDDDLGGVAAKLLGDIERHSQVEVRCSLLEVLSIELASRGAPTEEALASLARAAAEPAPDRRDTGTPRPYDDIEDMNSLGAALSSSSKSKDYDASNAFNRLLPTTDFDQALALFDKTPGINLRNESRFALVDRAMSVGRRDIALRLTRDYDMAGDDSASWTWTMGGGRRRYFQARLKLDGHGAHEAAYDDFASALAAGNEMIGGLLWDVEDIWRVLAKDPDWVVMWEHVHNQLPESRDYRLGREILDSAVESDSALVAQLFIWAIAPAFPELKWHVERGLVALALSDETALTTVIESLLSGDSPSILDGLQLASSWAPPTVQAKLVPRVGSLANHDDLGIRLLAATAVSAWGGAADSRERPPANVLRACRPSP